MVFNFPFQFLLLPINMQLIVFCSRKINQDFGRFIVDLKLSFELQPVSRLSYTVWFNHGEREIQMDVDSDTDDEVNSNDGIDDLMNDSFRYVAQAEGVYEGSNEDARKFYNLVDEASQELYPGEFQIEDNIEPLDPKTVASIVQYGRFGRSMTHQAIGYSLVYNQLYPFEGLQNYTSDYTPCLSHRSYIMILINFACEGLHYDQELKIYLWIAYYLVL